MTAKTITQLTALAAADAASADVLPIVDVSDTSMAATGTTKKITLTELQSAPVSAGTANGMMYLNGSKVATSGSALTFDGSVLGVEAELDVKSAANLLFLNSDNTNYMYLNNPAGSGAGIGQLAFTLGGVGEQMRLTPTGLGIGTSSPGARLDVTGTGNIVRIATATENATPNFFFSNENAQQLQFYLSQDLSNQRIGNARGGLIFDTGALNTERMRIDSSGNLGIGTSYPSAKLEVSGNAMLSVGRAYGQSADVSFSIGGTDNGYVNNGATSHWRQYVAGNEYGQALRFEGFVRTSGWTERMHLDSSGNLGLGVTPSAWGTAGSAYKVFQYGISGFLAGRTGNEIAILGTGAYNDGTNWRYTLSGNFASHYSQASGHHTWYTAPSGTAGNTISFTQAMTLDANGNLLVGTTSGSFSQVSKNGAYAFGVAQTGVGNNVLLVDGAYTSGTQNLVVFAATGTTTGTITYNGSAVAYNTSSDYRLKNITGPITTSGAYIDSLNPVEGTWKADGSTFVGLIAHEVQEVSRTQVATGEKDGEQMQAMDYSNSELIANLIAEVKSLRARVAALEAR